MNLRISIILVVLILNSAHFTRAICPSDSLLPFENSHFFIIDSVKIHCRIWNEHLVNPKGKVLLVHGFIASTFSWRMNIDTLVKSGYFVVGVDLPGFGYSDRNPIINQSQSHRANLLLKLIDSIDAKVKWNLVGHSMGGGVVEAMTLIKPDRINSLTIVDGMVFIKSENIQGAFVTLTHNKQYNKVCVSLVNKHVFTYGMIEYLFKRNLGYKPDSALVKGYLEPLMIPGTSQCVISVWSNAHEIAQLDARGFTKVPILVIWGKKDKTIYLRNGKHFVKHVPAAKLKIIPDAYHDPMESHPGEFNKLLIGFLNAKN